MTSKPEPTRQFLNNAIFQDFHQRLAASAALLRRIKVALPGPMAEHCLYCVAREDGNLVIYTDSQAFASQLRFHAPSILARLNADGDAAIKRIAIRNLALTAQPATAKPAAPMKKPSPQAIEAIRASSLSAPGDELAAALAHLAATMERYAAEEQPP